MTAITSMTGRNFEPDPWVARILKIKAELDRDIQQARRDGLPTDRFRLQLQRLDQAFLAYGAGEWEVAIALIQEALELGTTEHLPVEAWIG